MEYYITICQSTEEKNESRKLINKLDLVGL